jgi:hypothetical protein
MTLSLNNEKTLSRKVGPVAPKKASRDRAAEDQASKGRFVETLANLRQMRDAGELSEDLIQIAQAMILCGLPYAPTKENRVIRRARLGDGSAVQVVFSTGLSSEMPYGSDRTLLYWMIDKAIKTNSSFVSWETAAEFLRDVGMVNSGKNRADLKARYRRLSGLTIGIERTRAGSEQSFLAPLIEESRLPSSVDIREESAGNRLLPLDKFVFGFKLNDRIFRDVLSHHVPVPLKLLQETKRKSQLQDYMLFLYWRCYAAQSETVIPWKNIREQLWQGDSNLRRVKGRFAEAITALKVLWPQMQAEAQPKGLWIAPTAQGMHFLAEKQHVRRLPSGSL